MADTEDPDILQTIIKEKLPRMGVIKKSVDEGNRLDVDELDFLQAVFFEIKRHERSIEAYPALRVLYIDFVHLYCKVANTALGNEQRQ